MNRKTVYTIIVVVAVIMLIWSPFSRRNRNQTVQKAWVSGGLVTQLTSYVEEHPTTPIQLVTNSFDTHEIVFLGEYNQVKQQVDLVKNLIPALYKKGIYNLGMEFALYSDQPLIDRILTGSTYDEKAVEKVLFDRMTIWGFQEYAAIFHEAWQLNQGLSKGEPRFRIVGLNVLPKWNLIVDQKDLKDPKVMAQVFANGVPDTYMANVIEKEFISQGKKALIYTSLGPSFTKFVLKEYVKNAEQLQLSDTRRTGNIIYDKIGSKAVTILMNSPWSDSRAQLLVTYPMNGVAAQAMAKLPANLQNVGVLTNGTPFGGLSAGSGDFTSGYSDLKLEDMCYGYIFLGPIADYKPVTPIPNFITKANLATTLKDFPGPNIGDKTVEEMNTYLQTLADGRQRIFNLFK